MVLRRRLSHELAYGRMGDEQGIKLLDHQVGCFSAQSQRATQLAFDFAEGHSRLPTPLIERRQFLSQRLRRVELVGDGPIRFTLKPAACRLCLWESEWIQPRSGS